MKNIFLCIIFLLGIISCKQLNEPSNSLKYSMIGNLILNSSHQEMYIYNTIPLNENKWNDFPHTDNNYFVKNANILINNEKNITFRYNLNMDSSVYYYTANFNIKPLNRYTLKVVINGEEITGETYLPGSFSILSPLPEQHFTQVNDTIKIPFVWNASSNSFGYIIHFFEKYNGKFFRENSFVSQDTSFLFTLNERGRKKYKFEILAFDKNLYQHIIQKIPSAGIKGAYGYFGSSVMKSVTIKIN